MITESVVSKKRVRDHIISPSTKTHSFQIIRQLITSCNSAYSKYKDSLVAVEKAKAKKEVRKKRCIVICEISEISLKCNERLEVSKSLDEEFVATIREPEKDERNCFTVLEKGDTLKRNSEEHLVGGKKLHETFSS